MMFLINEILAEKEKRPGATPSVSRQLKSKGNNNDAGNAKLSKFS